MLHNETPYAADRTWVRDRHGCHHWLVVIKATFSIVNDDGVLELAPLQVDPLHVPEHFGDPATSSLRYDADLIGPKPGTDVIVNANAHAPGGRPVSEVPVALKVGSLQKTLVVRGPSQYVYGLTGLRVSTPQPFVIQPIRYEHAYGGSDTRGPNTGQHRHDARNPVGVGVTQQEPELHGHPAPCVYYPRGAPDKVGPAGFGAIASHWSPRRELAGTYDRLWFVTKRPLLPDDYDPAHTLCSPNDQRAQQRLEGGEQIVLVNLSSAGRLSVEIPRITFLARTRIDRRVAEHDFALATVIIEPDERRVMIVWQSSLPVSAPDIDLLIDTELRVSNHD